MTRGRDIDQDRPRDEQRSGGGKLQSETLDSSRDELSRAGEAGSEQKTRDERTPGSSRDPRERPETRERSNPVRLREHGYRLFERDLATLEEIGKFRTVEVDDLATYRFEGDTARAGYDLGRLRTQGLVRFHTARTRHGAKVRIVALTRPARMMLETRGKRSGRQGDDRQRFYADLKKPAEILHDAAIYRMYQAEAARIASKGGRVRRVVLDYELKKKIYRPLARARAVSLEEYAMRQQQIAREHGLQVVDGRIPLPDLRVEYDTREGEAARVDLELATEHYKASQLAAKLRAGFHIYIAGTDRSGGSVVRDERELTEGILSI